MKKYSLLLLVLIFAVALASCGRNKNNKPEEKKLPIVKTTVIQGQYFEENYKVSGIVKPYESAKLSSEEGGLIVYLT